MKTALLSLILILGTNAFAATIQLEQGEAYPVAADLNIMCGTAAPTKCKLEPIKGYSDWYVVLVNGKVLNNAQGLSVAIKQIKELNEAGLCR